MVGLGDPSVENSNRTLLSSMKETKTFFNHCRDQVWRQLNQRTPRLELREVGLGGEERVLREQEKKSQLWFLRNNFISRRPLSEVSTANIF
jgi:hypothetical protein